MVAALPETEIHPELLQRLIHNAGTDSMTQTRIVLASSNAGKIRELNSLLEKLRLSVEPKVRWAFRKPSKTASAS